MIVERRRCSSKGGGGGAPIRVVPSSSCWAKVRSRTDSNSDADIDASADPLLLLMPQFAVLLVVTMGVVGLMRRKQLRTVAAMMLLLGMVMVALRLLQRRRLLFLPAWPPGRRKTPSRVPPATVDVFVKCRLGRRIHCPGRRE